MNEWLIVKLQNDKFILDQATNKLKYNFKNILFQGSYENSISKLVELGNKNGMTIIV